VVQVTGWNVHAWVLHGERRGRGGSQQTRDRQVLEAVSRPRALPAPGQKPSPANRASSLWRSPIARLTRTRASLEPALRVLYAPIRAHEGERAAAERRRAGR
jgi:hypothetical protein